MKCSKIVRVNSELIMGLGFPIAYKQKFRRNILENLKNIALGPNLSQKALICVMFC